MTTREYRGKIHDAKRRLVANNYRAIEGFILRDDVLVEHWTLQSYGEDICFDKRCEDELLEMLEKEYPFLSFTLEDGEVRWKLKRAR